MGGDPAQGLRRRSPSSAGDARRSRRCSTYLSSRAPRRRRQVRPAARRPVPAGRRARLRGPRRRRAADRRRHRHSRPRCRSTALLAALPDEPVEFADRGGFETSDEEYAGVVRRIIDDEIGNGEGANLVVGRHYRAQLDGVGSGAGADGAAAAARARARRLLDLLLLHRRALPRRRQPRAARLRARRRRPDEPDQRHLPARGVSRRPSARRGCWSSSPTRRRSTSSSWSSTRSSR